MNNDNLSVEIRLFDILWRVKGAGPSPDDNRRTELYFGGCSKALSGHPCDGCFNTALWDGSCCKKRMVGDVINVLEAADVPKYITIVGGEPTDQPEALNALAEELKKRGYHLMLFTWRTGNLFRDCLVDERNFDIIVKGPYVKEKRIYDENLDDGVHNAIGSGNQIIEIAGSGHYQASEVERIELTEDGEIRVFL